MKTHHQNNIKMIYIKAKQHISKHSEGKQHKTRQQQQQQKMKTQPQKERETTTKHQVINTILHSHLCHSFAHIYHKHFHYYFSPSFSYFSFSFSYVYVVKIPLLLHKPQTYHYYSHSNPNQCFCVVFFLEVWHPMDHHHPQYIRSSSTLFYNQ
eukprot:73354_1